MQETIKAGRMSLDKVAGEHDLVDLATKGLSEDRMSI